MSENDTNDSKENNIELYKKMVVDHNYANKNEKIKHSKPLIFSDEGKEIFDFYKSRIVDYDYSVRSDADADPEEQLKKAENMIERLQELNLQMSSMMDQLLLENYELRKSQPQQPQQQQPQQPQQPQTQENEHIHLTNRKIANKQTKTKETKPNTTRKQSKKSTK
ncbi:MAG: hypothetical protein JSR17_01050 [Proteobacteria bacterium]|nr:hypothetical protein [Pseudomonadota bacterium]